MLEKLDIDPILSVGTNRCIINKLNELVDAVNELLAVKEIIFRPIDALNDTIENTTNSKMESMQDKFAEQRMWIGKLCRFWDEKEEEKVFGILTTIDSDCGLSDMCPYWNDTTKNWFEHCEPVKPDDDIIYRGE